MARRTEGGPGGAPALVLGVGLLALGLLVWPAVAGRFVPLDWYVGDLRPAARGLGLLFGVAGVGVLGLRRRVGARLARSFPDTRTFLFAAGSVLLAVVAALVLAEVAFRALGLPFRERWTPSENAVARFDPELGWSYIPDHSVTQEFGSQRRPIELSFDSIGARAGSAERRLDPQAPTAIFVGGSVTMGHAVTHEESFPGVLESMEPFPLQVVNLAVQGYGTDQSLLRLERHIGRFDTRVVVYGFICDHVKRNANADRRLLYPDSRFLGTKPRFELGRDGRPRLEQTPRLYEEIGYSRVAAYARIFLTLNGPKPGLGLTRALVREMKELTEARGAFFLVLYWYSDDAVGLCGPDPFEGLDVHVVNTAEHEPPGWEFWGVPGDGHPDARAHAHVARLLLDELRRLSFAPRKAAV
jgi:hypothetical protein